jgi:hypothetical protein
MEQVVMYLGAIFYGIVVVYITYHDTIYTTGFALGTAIIVYLLSKKNLAAALILGSIVGLIVLHYRRSIREGFEEEREDEEGFQDEGEDEDEDKKEGFDEAPKKKKKARKANPPPNNRDRAEFLDLGKKYKAPSEDDDKEFHLDAGTTFLNAYKSLKPDQVAAMTKDTQDLMQTQKQLMSTLSTLKPLIKDGKEMMNVFQSYFGANDAASK